MVLIVWSYNSKQMFYRNKTRSPGLDPRRKRKSTVQENQKIDTDKEAESSGTVKILMAGK